MSSICDLLGIDLPIIQAPMAGVQGSAMAIAVSNAGGLGSLPCALLSRDAMREELETISRHTSKPFNVNFFCHATPVPDPRREASWRDALRPYYDELGLDMNSMPSGAGRGAFSADAADLLSEFTPPVVSFHFGLPSPDLLQQVRAWGGKVLSSATTIEEARWLEARGVDAIIAQGLEAGGHRGIFLTNDLTTQSGTFALVPQLVAPARGIVNRIIRELGPLNPLAPEFPLATPAILPLRAKAEASGSGDFSPLWSGQNTRGCKNVPAADLTRAMAGIV